MRPITADIFYVGVNDRQKDLFENMLPLPHGVSYNSYLILDEKTALVDSVEISFAEQYIHDVLEVLQGRKLDYLVINHMEPDHSGSIRILRQFFPDVTIVGNSKTLSMLQGYFGITNNLQEIKDGEILSLGKNDLQFFLTPMVHWPETMVSYCIQQQVLFSGDAFGCFGALNGGIIDSELTLTKYWDEMIRYYACIVGKYGAAVQKALEKLKDLPISYICSTHGPVWRDNITRVISTYDKMSLYTPLESGVVLVYASMYGNTERMAEAVAQGLSQGGIKNIIIHNVSRVDSSYILCDIFKYGTLIIGSPTYSNTLYPGIESLLSKIELRTIKNRKFGYFASCSWAGIAAKKLALFADNLKWIVVGESVEMKQGGTKSDFEACIKLGKCFGE